MKNLKFYLIAVSGWVACGFAIYWGYHHCDDNSKSLVKQITSIQTTKQNPTGTFVDEAGREHVQYRDGSTAKIPTTKAQQQAYTKLRDTLLGPAIAWLLDKDVKVTQVTKVTATVSSPIPQSALNQLVDSIRTDKWTKVTKTIDGILVTSDVDVNSAKYITKSGLFNIKKTPMISFFTSNPNGKINGFARYDEPMPIYQPALKFYMQGEYDFVLQKATTDFNASFRLGKFEIGGFGRLSLNLNETDFQNRDITPSYGAKITYNLKQY